MLRTRSRWAAAIYYVENAIEGGDVDHEIKYGRAGDEVLVGDWDG